jgi:hypothetical protein
VSERNSAPQDPAQVARDLAAALDAVKCEYAIGGAIALGFWAEPRGTIDVDVTLFLPPKELSGCIRLLQKIGCTVEAGKAMSSLGEHGYCEVSFRGNRIDVFLPMIGFYELARQRRKRVLLGDQSVVIWDAETLCVFKMMFFRRKDIADVEQALRTQGKQLDRDWVFQRLVELYGSRDPRVSQWEELVREIEQ